MQSKIAAFSGQDCHLRPKACLAQFQSPVSIPDMRHYLLLGLPLILSLTQCTDPYGNPVSPFGSQNPAPYSDAREQYRSSMRENDRGQTQQAYEQGMRDGRDDAMMGRPRGNRRMPNYSTPALLSAFNDGYEQGYRTGGQGGSMPGFGGAPAYPGPGSLNGGAADFQPGGFGSPNPGQNDPAYSQGYEYGLRDRVAGRQADAGAHVGRYDPRYRRSFERGYHDAFERR